MKLNSRTAISTILVVLSVASRAQTIPSDGLVAYFPFNGDAKDESGHGHDGILIGVTMATDRFGKPASCASFDGGSYISASSDGLPAGERTVSLWFNSAQKILSDHPAPVLLGYGGGCGTSFWEYLKSDGSLGIASHCSGPSDSTPLPAAIEAGMWHHAVVIVRTNRTDFFYDGLSLRSDKTAFSETAFAPLALYMSIGVDNDSGTGTRAPYVDGNITYFKGLMDDIRIYNRALSPQESVALYRAEFPGHIPPSLAIAVKSVEVTMQVTPGKNYQLQSSTDLVSWSNVGGPFLATSSEATQDLDVGVTEKFFRVFENQ